MTAVVALLVLLLGCLTAVAAWPRHDCGVAGCSQRRNRWHSHPGVGE